jgi:hypothetical protein
MDYRQSQTIVTALIAAWMKRSPEHDAFISRCFLRHFDGDWGSVCEEDRLQNEEYLKDEGMLMSIYTFNDATIWIITDPGHEITTALFPEEY